MNVADLGGTDIVVVGLGAATAIGQSAAATAAAVRAGIAGFAEHPYMIDARGDPFVIAIAPYLAPSLGNEPRMVELARMAAEEAMAVALSVPGLKQVRMIVGLPSPRPGLRPDLATRLGEQLADEVFDGIRVSGVQLLPNGHSAGLMAIGAACRDLRDGTAAFLLAGGVDSHIACRAKRPASACFVRLQRPPATGSRCWARWPPWPSPTSRIASTRKPFASARA